MSKFLKFFVCFVCLSVLISCRHHDNKEDQEPDFPAKASIVGEWKCIFDAYGDRWDEPLIFCFDKDGTGYEWFSDEPFSWRWNFLYTIQGSSLLRIEYYDDYDGEINIFRTDITRFELSSDGNSLVIYGIDDDDMSELHFSRTR